MKILFFIIVFTGLLFMWLPALLARILRYLMGNPQSRRQPNSQTQSNESKPRATDETGKVFESNEGEYIDFVEVKEEVK